VYSDVEDDDRTVLENLGKLDSSEWDLAMQLELARRNSQNQHGKAVAPLTLEKPVEATIYEGFYDRYFLQDHISLSLFACRGSTSTCSSGISCI